MEPEPDLRNWVGPVLQRGPAAEAIIGAIRALHPEIRLVDRGAYIRVLVPRRCILTREALEAKIARPVRLASELEASMSSFKGMFQVNEDEAVWEFKQP